MPDRAYQRRSAARRRRARWRGGALGEWPQRQAFEQTLSFKPGFYRKWCETEKKGAWQDFSDWVIWREDCSQLSARRSRGPGSEFRGSLRYEPYPAEMPHEILFQPRVFREWMDTSRVSLWQDETHWTVECPARQVRGFNRLLLNRARLAFPRSGVTGDLPDRIKVFGYGGSIEAKLLDFRPGTAGRFLPTRFLYERHGISWPRASGEVRIVSSLSRFTDGPEPPSARVDVLDSRLGEPEKLQMNLRREPPPLWFVRLHRDWRQGVIRIPLGGQVFFGPLLQPAALMLLLLTLALGQRSYLRRRRRLSPP